jgi:hypothetical protein
MCISMYHTNKIMKSINIIYLPLLMKIWRRSKLPLKINPMIHNLKNSAHPPFAPFRFWYLSVTVSFWLPFKFVTARSEFHSGPIFWLVSFRFCFISDFRFTFSDPVSLLLQLHYGFFLTLFVWLHLHYSSPCIVSVLLHLHYSTLTLF